MKQGILFAICAIGFIITVTSGYHYHFLGKDIGWYVFASATFFSGMLGLIYDRVTNNK